MDRRRKCGMAVLERSIGGVFPVGELCIVPVDRMCMLLVTGGSCTVEVDGNRHELCRRAMLYLHPNHQVRVCAASPDLSVAGIEVVFDFLSDFPLLLKADKTEFVSNRTYCDLSAADYELLMSYYALLADRYASQEAGDEVLKGILFSMVAEVSRIYSGHAVKLHATRKYELVDRFFSLLSKNFAQEHAAAFYAGQLCVSDKHLMRVIKEVTGRSFHFWMSDFVLRDAKLLLLSSDMTVAQISDRLCFPSSSSFARFFRRGTGVSPTEYRTKK